MIFTLVTVVTCAVLFNILLMYFAIWSTQRKKQILDLLSDGNCWSAEELLRASSGLLVAWRIERDLAFLVQKKLIEIEANPYDEDVYFLPVPRAILEAVNCWEDKR